jgi:hypothetical protein
MRRNVIQWEPASGLYSRVMDNVIRVAGYLHRSLGIAPTFAFSGADGGQVNVWLCIEMLCSILAMRH